MMFQFLYFCLLGDNLIQMVTSQFIFKFQLQMDRENTQKDLFKNQLGLNSEEEEDRQLQFVETIMKTIHSINIGVVNLIRYHRTNVRKLYGGVSGQIHYFDQLIDNESKMRLKANRSKLIHFEIDAISIRRQQEYFAESIYMKQSRTAEAIYMGNIIFSKKDKESVYRMHLEIWKLDNGIRTSNKILTLYERNCMQIIYKQLHKQNWVDYVIGDIVKLKTLQPLYKGSKKQSEFSFNIIERVKQITKQYLQHMITIFDKQIKCQFCQNHMFYEECFNLMAPPTIVIAEEYLMMKQEKKIQRQPDIYHQRCFWKCFRLHKSNNLDLLCWETLEAPKFLTQAESSNSYSYYTQ